MRSSLSIIILMAAVAVFYLGIDPAYNNPDDGVKILRTKMADYNTALDNSAKLRQLREELMAVYNKMDPDDLTRLQKMLPDGVDNIRLILDIDSMAARYGMSIKNISITQDTTSPNGATASPNQNPIGSIKLAFAVTTSYENYLQFLADLERSLRVVDVVGLAFSASDKENTATYTTTLQTYWLK